MVKKRTVQAPAREFYFTPRAFYAPGLGYGKTTRLRLKDCRRFRRNPARCFEMAKQRRAV